MDRVRKYIMLPRPSQSFQLASPEASGPPAEVTPSSIPRKPTFRLHHSIAKISRASAVALDTNTQSFIDYAREKVTEKLELIKSVNFEIGPGMSCSKGRFSEESLGILSPSEMKDFSICDTPFTEEDEGEKLPPDLLNFTVVSGSPKKSRLTFSPKKPKMDEKETNATFDKKIFDETVTIYSPPVSDLILSTKAIVSGNPLKIRESDPSNPMIGSLVSSSIVTSVTSLGSMDGYQGDAEGTGTQNTPVHSLLSKSHPFVSNKFKEGASSLETSGVYSDFETQTELEANSTFRIPDIDVTTKHAKLSNKLEVVNRPPGKTTPEPSPRRPPSSSRSSVASTSSSVATKIFKPMLKPDPKLRSKEAKDAANGAAKARKLATPRPLKQMVKKVEVKEVVKPPVSQARTSKSATVATQNLPAATRSSVGSRIPAPRPSRIRSGPSPNRLDRPPSRVSSLSAGTVEASPNRRPAPYAAKNRPSLVPPSTKLPSTANKAKSPLATSTPDGNAPGPVRRKTVSGGQRFTKHESTFRSNSPSPVQKALANAPATLPQWKQTNQQQCAVNLDVARAEKFSAHRTRQLQTSNKGLMAFAVLIGHSQKQVDNLKEELKTLAIQQTNFNRLKREKDELLKAIGSLKDDLDNGRLEYTRTVAELQEHKAETQRICESHNLSLKRILEDSNQETSRRLEEQASHLHEFYRKEINSNYAQAVANERAACEDEIRRATQELKDDIRRLRKENISLSERVREKDDEIRDLRNQLILPLEARIQAQMEKYNAEIASLGTVVTMRNEEVKKGRTAVRELERQSEELLVLRDKLQKSELCIEDLNERLKIEREEKRRCEQANDNLCNQIKSESQKLKRLSMDKEQLEYKLNSYSGVDLSQCNSPVMLRSAGINFTFTGATPPIHNSTPGVSSPRPPLISSAERRSLSPVPQSPGVMRRVIAKSESLSYVLGFDDGEDLEVTCDVRSPKTSI